MHVFNWNEQAEKFPLIEGRAQWDEYFKVLNDENSGERVCFLEFMPDGELSSLSTEATSLKTILGGIEK